MTARPYKVICISVFAEDLVAIDAKVAELKRRGYTRANRSMLVRCAIAGVDPAHLAPEMAARLFADNERSSAPACSSDAEITLEATTR